MGVGDERKLHHGGQAQAEDEVKNGKEKPSTPLRGSVVLGQFQAGFIGFIKPLFASLDELPGLDLGASLANLDANRAHWLGTLES